MMDPQRIGAGLATILGTVGAGAAAAAPFVGELAGAAEPLGVPPATWIIVSALLAVTTIVGRMAQAIARIMRGDG